MLHSSNESTPKGRGMLASVQGLMATVMAIFHTRLELFLTEVEEEKRRLMLAAAWGAVGVLVGCFGLAFLAVFITALFWDTHRLWVLGGITLTFFLVSVGAMLRVRALFRDSGDMFSGTREELKADFEAMGAASRASEVAHRSGERG